MQREFDIAIVGGGLAGASLACCLENAKLKVVVLEQFPLDTEQQPSYDDRGLALSLASSRILKAIKVWPELANQAVPIRHLHVSDRGRFGFTHLHATDLNLEAMGYVIVAREIGRALLKKLSTMANIEYLCPETVSAIEVDEQRVRLELAGKPKRDIISCKLLVAADGSNSNIREKLMIETEVKDYRQTAIVSNITMDKVHENTAYERFTSQGPLALLPMSDTRFASVFCIASEMRDEYMQMPDRQYLSVMQNVMSMRPGKIINIGRRQAYPLNFIRAKSQFVGRVVLLGNAAHTLHPNAAQGFNLGLRDAAFLGEILQKYADKYGDPGNHQLLQNYVDFRTQDQQRVIAFTDTLASLFYNDNYLKSLCRNIGLCLLDVAPAIKNKFALQAMGIDGKQPGLVRGLSIDQL